MSDLKKAVVVIRHGQKGIKHADGTPIVEDIPDPNPPALPWKREGPHTPEGIAYFDEAMSTAILDQTAKHINGLMAYCDISITGYEEGTSFATTVPLAIKGFQPITRAIILSPSVNGNTYLTSFPLLQALVTNGTLKSLKFYSTGEEIKDILIPTEEDGSVLVAGDANTLKKKDHSIIHELHKHYGIDADDLQRGRYIYVYSDNPDKLTRYTQNPDTKTISTL